MLEKPRRKATKIIYIILRNNCSGFPFLSVTTYKLVVLDSLNLKGPKSCHPNDNDIEGLIYAYFVNGVLLFISITFDLNFHSATFRKYFSFLSNLFGTIHQRRPGGLAIKKLVFRRPYRSPTPPSPTGVHITICFAFGRFYA